MKTSSLLTSLKLGTVIYVSLLLFIAPIKFGNILYTSTIGSFPLSLLEWMFMPWPPALIPVLCGVALFLALIAFPVPGTAGSISPWYIVAAWGLLTAGTVPGFFGTTEWDRGLLFFFNLLSALTLATAILIILVNRPRTAPPLLLTMVAAGSFFATAYAWYEIKGGGLENTLEFAEEQAAARGEILDPRIRSRLTQRRATGTFFYPNSFAAHLLLTLPLCLAMLWRWGAYVTPPLLTRIIFLTAASAFGGMALLWSGSRAAIVALGCGLILSILLSKTVQKRRITLAFIAFALILSGIIIVNHGRTLSSLEARVNYWKAAGDMAVNNPLKGVGLGEFYPEFARRLKAGEELTRQPHNFWLLFAAEAGVAGAIAAAFFMTLPLWFHKVKCRNSKVRPDSDMFFFAGRTGLAAWIIHALTDMNFHIPGTMITAAALPFILLADCSWPEMDTEAVLPASRQSAKKMALALLGLLTLFGGWRLPGDLALQRLINAKHSRKYHLSELRSLAETAARRLPTSPYPLLVLSDAAKEAGHPHLAAEACRQALERTPHRGSVWLNLAKLEDKIGNQEAANEAFSQAVKWGGVIMQKPGNL